MELILVGTVFFAIAAGGIMLLRLKRTPPSPMSDSKGEYLKGDLG